jgi:prevent-host-death family protein
MSETQMSLSDLRQQLSSAINRAAYGGERIVLVSHGQPKAIIIGIDEWRRVEERAAGEQGNSENFTRVITTTDQLRERIAQWQATHSVIAEPVEETLRSLREGHDDDLDRVR